MLNQRGLEDKFNSDWSDSKLFILAEEVVTRAEMWHIKNELKELVSGEWIRINPKNIAAYRQRNQVNICYLSNEGQPLPIDNDDRRHLVVYTPPALSEEYYDDVFRRDRGRRRRRSLSVPARSRPDRLPPEKRPPMTDAKQRLMMLSSPSEVRFATEWITGDLGLPVCPALAGDVYATYLRWCRANGESRPRPSITSTGRSPICQAGKRRSARFPERSCRRNRGQAHPLPSGRQCRAAGNGQVPGTAAVRWLTECVAKFAEASKTSEGNAWAA